LLTLKYDTDGKLLWIARYDGPAGGGDEGLAIAVDNSGNVYVTGVSLSTGGNPVEFVTIKYAPNGDVLWVARYPTGAWPVPLAVDNQNSVYVAGRGDAGEYLVIKYDSDGHQV
jgi:hypothetical protein